MVMISEITIKSGLGAAHFQLPDFASRHQKSQITIDSAQADVRNSLSYNMIDFRRGGVDVGTFHFLKNHPALSGLPLYIACRHFICVTNNNHS